MSESQDLTPAAEAAPVAGPSRTSLFLRRALRWTTATLTVFALGIVALWLVQVQPLRERISTLERERQTLQAAVADLESQVTRLKDVEQDNEALQAAKASLELQMAVLNARLGAVKAQYLLAANGDPQAILETLAEADRRLDALEQTLLGAPQESVRSLRYRVAMVVGEIESNPFAAQRDLEVLADGLESLERDLAGG